MPSPALPGLALAFAGMVLLLFASVSPPVWDKVNFLDVTSSGTSTVYGVFGKCVKGGVCDHRSLGYDLDVSGISTSLNSGVLHNLTYTMILHPIAGGFALFALLFGLLAICAASRIATILMALSASLGALIALVVFVIDMVLWNVLKNRVNDNGGSASLGNANWFTVGAVVALFLSMCTSVCGACGRFATGRMAGEKY